MNSKKYLERLEKADELIEESMTFWKVPGAAVAIVTKDEVLFSKGFGFRDATKKLPVTPKTVFPLASITKSFTAMGVALLVDEGKLSWDDRVQQHLPWFRLKDDYAGAHLTIRDLLCHRSGLPRHDLLWYGTNISRKEGLRKLAHLELSKGFREEWQYQNIMFTTAGFLAGEIAGSSWETLTQAKIFKPLKLTDTVCVLKDFLKKSNKALGYKKQTDEEVKKVAYRNRLNAGPAGSVFSNVTDVGKWLQLHLGQGKYQIDPKKSAQFVSKKNLAEMHSPQMIIRNAPSFKTLYGTPIDTYGLGWFIRPYRGKTMIEHGGNIDGFSTLASFFPDEGLGMIVLANLESTPFRRAVTHSLYDMLFEVEDQWDAKFKKFNDKAKRGEEVKKEKNRKARKKNTKPSHALKDFAGTYQHSGYADIVTRLRKGKLEGFLMGKYWPLEHYHYNIFEMIFEDDNREKIKFEVAEDGKVASFKFKIEPALEPATFTKQTRKPVRRKK